MNFTDATAAWLVPSIATLAAVILGGAVTIGVNALSARRARRRALAERALEAVTTARLGVAAARMKVLQGRPTLPLQDVPGATAIHARFDHLAGSERGADRRAIASAGYMVHEWLLGGAASEAELTELQSELLRLSWLLLAWERRDARGRDFKLPHSVVRDRFAPPISDEDMVHPG